MLGEQPVIIISLQIIAGMLLATGLLHYTKRYSEKTRQSIAGLALVVAALIYVLFASLSQNHLFITIEILGVLFFLLLVWLGFKYSFWFVVFGWLLHVLWDFGLHPSHIAPYVPHWYAWLCVGFDIIVALYLAATLIRSAKQE